jgi:hypothetical protein
MALGSLALGYFWPRGFLGVLVIATVELLLEILAELLGLDFHKWGYDASGQLIGERMIRGAGQTFGAIAFGYVGIFFIYMAGIAPFYFVGQWLSS